MNDNDITALRQEIGEKYKNLTSSRRKPFNQKLYLYLTEPCPEMKMLSIIYRGNYKFFFNARIEDDHFAILAEVLLDYSDYIVHLDLSYNEITETSLDMFCKVLEISPHLESLNLQFNYLRSKGGNKILEALSEARRNFDGKTNLKYLNLEGNEIKTTGLLGITPDEKLFEDKQTSIEKLLLNNEDLEELNLSNNEIDDYGIIETITYLNQAVNMTNLDTLCLDNPFLCGIGQVSAFHIGRMLQTNKCLSKLSLRKQGLNDEGIYVICEHLLENERLRVLDLGANKISYKGCQSLTKVLKSEYCALESLILNNNRTGYFGALAISDSIENNRTLVHLDMSTNDIDDEGLALIAKALFKNEILVSVKLYWNHFDTKSKDVFHKLLCEENPNRTSDWFLDFTTYIVDDQIQIAYVDNALPYDIFPPKKYYIDANV
jgi:Ran GTPase-activating protein (RanGAP) involved in mRNA processing and transport